MPSAFTNKLTYKICILALISIVLSGCNSGSSPSKTNTENTQTNENNNNSEHNVRIDGETGSPLFFNIKQSLNTSSLFSGAQNYQLINPPAGLTIQYTTGQLYWQPGLAQAGEHKVKLAISGNNQSQEIELSINISSNKTNPTGIYVDPIHGTDNSTSGKITQPYKSLRYAAQQANAGETIYIRGGEYSLTSDHNGSGKILAKGVEGAPITFTRLAGERVKFNFTGTGIEVPLVNNGLGEQYQYLIFEGFELDGNADDFTEEDVIKLDWWKTAETPLKERIGGTGFNINGQHIIVRKNVIHNAYQKGVNIRDGRYVTVEGNIIYDIGHNSLTGGHGIMRMWEKNFGTPDEPDTDRFNFTGNLLFRVEQHIYSWAGKPFANLTIDEGKSILIDQTTDTQLTATVSNNLVLFGGKDHIRLKPTPNIEVFNNTVVSDPTRTDPYPGGISEKAASSNMHFYNNLATTNSADIAIQVNKSFSTSTPARLYNNFVKDGKISSESSLNTGIDRVTSDMNLFVDSANNNYRLNPSLGLHNVGVSEQWLSQLEVMLDDYGIKATPSNWVHKHDSFTQLILDNYPREYFQNPTCIDSVFEPGRKAVRFDITDAGRSYYIGNGKASAWPNDIQTFEVIVPESFNNTCIVKY
ncbi:hypothetical protein C942_02786 [Photobacterium marinum]|uniref:Uncharacterized protein n=1 Tax=Photobacterium marinum TaxID=1056511 RepID=L8JIM7_9GAMM|nr:hypothetical protein [Photobacterium marinum]ELR67277.1 hypothetical protein C942_02786 [Photobacterium marinum]